VAADASAPAQQILAVVSLILLVIVVVVIVVFVVVARTQPEAVSDARSASGVAYAAGGDASR
jgi:heme/copper-type cytochrome/quinol oxidase subunit 2